MARGKSSGRFRPGRRGGEDAGKGDAWLTTYGDAITLLLAFFVMLYAMSTTDAVKFKALISGLEAPFGNTAVAQGLMGEGGGIVGDGGTQPELQKMENPPPFTPNVRPSPVDGKPAQEAPTPAPTPTEQPERKRPEPKPTPDQLEQVRQALDRALRRRGFERRVEYRRNERGLVVSVATDDVLFATGSTEIAPLGRRLVTTIGRALAPFRNTLLVEGHTDDVPLQRDGYTNWNLSTDRAVAVVQLLARTDGLASGRLGASGYGEFRPRASNATPQGQSLNRRVDILVIAEGAR